MHHVNKPADHHEQYTQRDTTQRHAVLENESISRANIKSLPFSGFHGYRNGRHAGFRAVSDTEHVADFPRTGTGRVHDDSALHRLVLQTVRHLHLEQDEDNVREFCSGINVTTCNYLLCRLASWDELDTAVCIG